MRFANDHEIKIKFPSTVIDPSSLARGLTSARMYIDEAQNIKDFEKIYTSCRPAIEKASEQARRTGFPNFMLISGTPNGKVGLGEPFFNLVNQCVNADLIFEERPQDTIIDKSIKLKPNAREIINTESTNNFVYVRYHWSYDKSVNPKCYTRQEDLDTIPWYINQKRALQNNRKRILQEIDIVFTNTTSSVFSDDVSAQVEAKNPIERFSLSHQASLSLFDKINTKDFYLIGVKSTPLIAN